MQVELRRNVMIKDFWKYKIALKPRAVYMNENTLLRFMRQLARVNKWGEDSLSPEQIVRELIGGIDMDMEGTHIKHLATVPDNVMETAEWKRC